MKHLPVGVIAAALAISIAACGSDKSANTTSAPNTGTTFVLGEWSVVPPKGDLPAGKLSITATNNGKEIRELVLVSASDAATLPKNADGSVNEDKIPEAKKAGEIADLAVGKTKTKTFDLPAGDYVAFCNIVEDMSNGGTGNGSGMGGGTGMHHVHFTLGMVNYFTVA